jgi:intein/homing endonuclease
MYKVEVKKLDNYHKFTEAADTFKENGYYTAAPRGTKEYREFWQRELDRCIDGYMTDDGEYITGYYYFYLNYCPILQSAEREYTDKYGNTYIKKDRKRDFPKFYDYDRAYFDAIEMAERSFKHLSVIKKRGAGYSFKGGAMLCRNFYCIPDSRSYAIAAEMEFLTRDGLLTKAWEFMDFIDQNTAWSKKRQKVDTRTHKRASIVTDVAGVKTEIGYKSEIMGISLKNDPQKARGKRGKLILWEEAGKFPNLKTAWQIAQPSVEDDDGKAYGLMIAFGTGGCLTEGNMVWDSFGNLKDIKDLKEEDGILGFSGEGISDENITYFQEPTEKECVKITTNTRRTIECSWDHPILTAVQTKGIRGNIKEKVFLEADKLKVGNKIAIIDEVPIFGNKKMWEPRVVGWLIGDGSYGNKQQPRISNCEEEINSYIENNLNHTIQLERKTKSNKDYKEITLRGYNQHLRDLGIYGQTKLKKTLPKDIHSYSKEDLREFIGGLFDTDGYVNIRKNKSRNTDIAEVSISQASESLLNEIRLLLQKFGIHGRIRERQPRENNPKDKNPWYEFTISDTVSLLRFWQNIKLYPKVKQNRLDEIFFVFSHVKPHRKYKGYRYEEIISIEEVGVKPVYNLTAGKTNTYIGNGIITHNTEDANFEGLKDIFYEPNAYNCLPIENEWDEGAQDSYCGFFVPQYMNMYGDDGEDVSFMDENGNSDIKTAVRYSLTKREEVISNSTDRSSIDRFIAERPFTPVEACLEISSNIFPKKDLIKHLADIRNSEAMRNYKQVGDLVWQPDGTVKWELNPKKKDITKYRLGPMDSKEGAIVIWEHPESDPPFGLYVGGIDPYDFDKSTTNSLGSCIIYKRYQNFEKFYNLPVAEYTGRPETAEEFYENCRKLAKYYGASVLYENEKKGLFTYFQQKHSEWMLADQPGTIKDIIKDSKVQRGKGIHMNKEIKMWGEGLIKEYLNEEFAPGQKNLLKIYSEPLLEELINYNDTGNFDRVVAFMMVMIYREELFNMQVKKKKEYNRDKMIFDGPVFTHNL